MASCYEMAETCDQEQPQQRRQVSDYYENLDLLQEGHNDRTVTALGDTCGGGNNGAGPDTSCAAAVSTRRATKVDEEFNTTRRHFIEYSNSGKKMNILLALAAALCLLSTLCLASLYGHVVPSIDQVAEAVAVKGPLKSVQPINLNESGAAAERRFKEDVTREISAIKEMLMEEIRFRRELELQSAGLKLALRHQIDSYPTESRAALNRTAAAFLQQLNCVVKRPLPDRSVRVISSACGGQLRDSTGGGGVSFTSPNYPHKYPKKELCTWTIKADPGKRVSLHFPDFELEGSTGCNTDSVRIFDASTADDSKELVKLCAKMLPIYNKPIRSSGNVLTVQFKSDGSVQDKGFKAVFREACPIYC